jgi:AcrR family transcriptional regulator
VIAGRSEVVEAAAAVLLSGARLDTGTLSARLGISRATLFRRVGNREVLLAEALWWLGDSTLREAERRYDGGSLRAEPGRLRCLTVMEEFRRMVATSVPIRSLLADEPALGIRLLTDPRGRVQPRLVEAHARLIGRDLEAHGLEPRVPLPVLCFGLVRLGESFLYSDVLAAREVDLAAATTVLDALVASLLVPPAHG